MEREDLILLSLKQIENEIVTLYKTLEHYSQTIQELVIEKERS